MTKNYPYWTILFFSVTLILLSAYFNDLILKLILVIEGILIFFVNLIANIYNDEEVKK